MITVAVTSMHRWIENKVMMINGHLMESSIYKISHRHQINVFRCNDEISLPLAHALHLSNFYSNAAEREEAHPIIHFMVYFGWASLMLQLINWIWLSSSVSFIALIYFTHLHSLCTIVLLVCVRTILKVLMLIWIYALHFICQTMLQYTVIMPLTRTLNC